jgi:hypothetical protein
MAEENKKLVISKVDAKQEKNKELMLEQLRKTPIVEIACNKVGIGRTTYYRMRKEDPEFAKKADEAIAEGTKLVNDAAETQILSAIKNGNLTAAIFWLKNKHPDYKDKIFKSALTVAQDENNNIYFELFGNIKPETEKLLEEDNDEQQPKQRL